MMTERGIVMFATVALVAILGVVAWTVFDWVRQPHCGGGAASDWIAECTKVRPFEDCERDAARVCQ